MVEEKYLLFLNCVLATRRGVKGMGKLRLQTEGGGVFAPRMKEY